MAKRKVTRARSGKKKNRRAQPAVTGPAELLVALTKRSGRLAALSDMPANPATLCLELLGTGLGFSIREPTSRRRSISFSPSPVAASPVQTVINIQLTIDVSQFPFPLLDGSISGDDFNAPPGKRWQLSTASDTALRDAFGLLFELVSLPFAQRTVVQPPGTSHTAVGIAGSPFYSATSGAETTIFSPLSGSVYVGFYQLDNLRVFYPCRMLFKGWEPCS